jgi:hypothetical protein
MAAEPELHAHVPIEVEIARTRALEPDFLGLTRDEAVELAKLHKVELRIVDSDDTALTADLRSRRITVDLRSGRVSSATAG